MTKCAKWLVYAYTVQLCSTIQIVVFSKLLQRSQTEEVQPTPPLVADHTHSQEELVEHLRAEVEKKTQMLLEVKKHVREAAEREREQALAVKERDALKEQVQMVRKTLFITMS